MSFHLQEVPGILTVILFVCKRIGGFQGWDRAGMGGSRLRGRAQDCEIEQYWRWEAARWYNTVNGLMPPNCSFKPG